MAPKYKLTYFNLRGLGEPIRYLLAQGGIDFDEVRINFSEWPNLKSTMPFGKMPVLEVDGKVMHQSIAICRYLAKQQGLAGSNDWEAYQIDAITDTVSDVRQAISQYGFLTEESEKPKKLEVLQKETLPFNFSRLDKIVKENKGYFVNGKLSYADLYFAALVEFWSAVIKTDVLAGYTNLKALVDKVHSEPRIKAWVAKRPKTEF